MDYKDYYAILGIEKSATQDEIKKAYRQLAKTWHPDKNPGSKVAETRFKEISEAYEVLSDVEKKKHYDNLGKDWNKYQQYNNPKEYYKQTRPNDKAPDFDIDDLFKSDGKNDGKGGFSDFFSNIFGDSNKKKPTKGQDYETEMEITLDDAYKGVTKIMTVLSQKLRIQLKPGVPHEQSLRLKGKGGEGTNGVPAGDLFVKVKILPHSLFKREGNDLHCELPVDLYTAVLGGKVFIATLDGGTNFILPAGTENGKTLRLKSKGMPDYNNPTNIGDLFVKLNVQIPKDLSSQEIELFTKLAEIRKK